MEEEDEAMGIPEWVVTFGDMMSLLLTFFIMLVSMSEIKEEEQYQAMVESIKKQFGHDMTPESIQPGDLRARKSNYRVMNQMGRAKRLDTHNGGSPTQAPVGDNDRVRIVRPGGETAIGTVVFFQDSEATLSEEAKRNLDAEIPQLTGKPQKIEVRGHTAQSLATQAPEAGVPMALGLNRSMAVMDYLIEQGIPAERIRLSTAGAWEPMYISNDPEKLRQNPRVEVFLLEETVERLVGTESERQEKILFE